MTIVLNNTDQLWSNRRKKLSYIQQFFLFYSAIMALIVYSYLVINYKNENYIFILNIYHDYIKVSIYFDLKLLDKFDCIISGRFQFSYEKHHRTTTRLFNKTNSTVMEVIMMNIIFIYIIILVLFTAYCSDRVLKFLWIIYRNMEQLEGHP